MAETWPEAQAIFDEVDEALGEKLSTLTWEGDADELTLTANAQPALMATSMAAMAALASEGVEVSAADFVAGHSLGEYSALCAAGALSLADTARLLRKRGEAMQSAVPVGEGAMAALLGLEFEQVTKIAEAAGEAGVCAAANDNDPGQVVVSGAKAAVEKAVDLAKEAGAKRAVMLPVSAPFHCDLMEPAAAVMAEEAPDRQMAAAVTMRAWWRAWNLSSRQRPKTKRRPRLPKARGHRAARYWRRSTCQTNKTESTWKQPAGNGNPRRRKVAPPRKPRRCKQMWIAWLRSAACSPPMWKS